MTDSIKDTAAQAQRAYAEQTARIRARKDLSPEGVRAHLAKAYTEHKSRMDELRAAQTADAEQRRADLVKEVFGSTDRHAGADLLSQRDAFTRADTIKTPDEAASMLRLARMSGDAELARAVAARAYDRAVGAIGGGREKWGSVLGEWAQDTGNAEQVDQLLGVDGIGRTRGQALTERLLNKMHTSASRPAELAGVPDPSEIARHADAEDRGDLTPAARKAADDLDVIFRPGGRREVG